MNSRKIAAILLVGAVATLFFLTSFGAPAHARYEAKVYVITDWGPPNCGINADDRIDWDNMVDAWYEEITDTGFSFWGICLWGHCEDAFSRDGRQVNGNMVNSQFADASIVTWGNDTNHWDEGDAVLAAWHGEDDNGVYVGSMRVDEAGLGDCDLRRDEMEIGDSDLEFLHLSSCHSMDQNMWPNWVQAFGRAHQVDGFHGLAWISSSYADDYRDFADDAFSMPIAEAWIDNLYMQDFAFYAPENQHIDQCPVAYAVGVNTTDAVSRITSERYNRILSDPTGSLTAVTLYIIGCDPADEVALAAPGPAPQPPPTACATREDCLPGQWCIRGECKSPTTIFAGSCSPRRGCGENALCRAFKNNPTTASGFDHVGPCTFDILQLPGVECWCMQY